MMVNRVTRVGDGGGGVVDGGEVTLWSRGWGGGEVSIYSYINITMLYI